MATCCRPNGVQRYPANDNSLPARYARAIARNCSGGCTQALPEVDALIRDRPENPYFWELKGELLLKAGLYGDAIAPLRKAASLLEQMKRTHPSVSNSQTQIMLAGAGLLERSAPAGRGDRDPHPCLRCG